MHRAHGRVGFASVGLLMAGVSASAQNLPWHSIDDALFETNAAYDPVRRRLVLFGLDGCTNEWDGTTWYRRPVVVSGQQPIGRRFPGIAFDRVRGRMVMFAGSHRGVAMNDTWTWDGVAWRPEPSTVVPPPRSAPLMTFSSAHGVVVMIGGINVTSVPASTWTFDGSQWQIVPSTASAPIANAHDAVIADDEANATPVIVALPLGATQPQTWTWNGSDWQLVTTPPAIDRPLALAHDATRQRLVLRSTSGYWARLGGAWVQELATTVRFALPTAAWHDPGRGEVVFVDGQESGDPAIRSWNGNQETILGRVPAPASPAIGSLGPRRFAGALVRDPLGRSLFFDGDGQGPTGVTWLFDGVHWSIPAVPVAPPARTSPAVALDEARGVVLLYGGTAAGAPLSDLWSWNGSTWSLVAATNAPGPRSGAQLSYDSARATTLLGGGSAAADLWEWDGSNWSQVASQLPLVPTILGFDRARSRHVLLAPAAGVHMAVEWDGTSLLTTNWPPIASFTTASVAWDPRRQRLLFAVDAGTFVVFVDYDGTTWNIIDQLSAEQGLGRLVFDESRGHLLLHAGLTTFEDGIETASAARFGSGCGTAPEITPTTRPRLGENAFGFEARTTPQTAVLFGLSTSQQTTPLPGGCQVLIGPVLASTFALVGDDGLVTVPQQLPLNPTLRGLVVFAQVGALDPATGALSLSAGLRVAVGD